MGRPAKDRRIQVERLTDDKLAYIRVTETTDMRNAGTSIVQDLQRKGWIKPEDPDILDATPDGLSFNMIMPKNEFDVMVAKNNQLARAMAGIRDHNMVKSVTAEDQKIKGSELLEAAGIGADNG